MIPVVIRCHVNTDERLRLLELTLKSTAAKLPNWKLYIADDQSALKDQVIALTAKYNAEYSCSTGQSSTNNGLAHALELVKNEMFSLQLCDDVVLGGNLEAILKNLINKPPVNVGAVSMFVPQSVDMHFRRGELNSDRLFKCDASSNLYHAWICVLISRDLNEAYRINWQTLKQMYPEIMDDHAIRGFCAKYGFGLYVTPIDYCLHTGMETRSFADPDGKQGKSNYQCAKFCGTKEERHGF